jgi:hypothetical protein
VAACVLPWGVMDDLGLPFPREQIRSSQIRGTTVTQRASNSVAGDKVQTSKNRCANDPIREKPPFGILVGRSHSLVVL